MQNPTGDNTAPDRKVRSWDTNTAAGALVIGAVVVLFLLNRGFRAVISRV